MTERTDSQDDPSEQWNTDRTTFQRIYDICVGTTESASVKQFATWADCSENGARHALEQLDEMGIAERTETRPVRYRRNPSYFRWKRVETLAREHSASELRDRLEELVATDQELQAKYEVPDPTAVVPDDPLETHEEYHERWDDLTEWRTIRRDIRLLKRAIQRADSSNDGRARV